MAAMATQSGKNWSHAISNNDHGPLVSIVTCLMLVGSLLFLVIRFGIRWPWKQLIGLDDMTVLIATVGLLESIDFFTNSV